MTVKKIIFSPTGGTEKVSNILAQNISDNIQTIDLCNPNFNGGNIDKNDLVIIAMPSFGGRAPQIAIQRLKQIDGQNARCILVCVYGNRAYEDTLIEMNDVASEQNFKVIAAISAVAQHSIIPKYASGRPDAKDEQILKSYVMDILNKNKDKITKIPGNHPYKKLMKTPLVPQPNNHCIKCGLCAKICPIGAINPKTLKADPKKCISCMRCVKLCPKKARKINPVMVKISAKVIQKACEKRKEAELFITENI